MTQEYLVYPRCTTYDWNSDGDEETVLLADWTQTFLMLMSEFGKLCERRKFKIRVGKSRWMSCSPSEGHEPLKWSRAWGNKGVQRQRINVFGGWKGKLVMYCSGNERARMMGGLGYLWRDRGLSIVDGVVMLKGIVTPSPLYGFKSWLLDTWERWSSVL